MSWYHIPGNQQDVAVCTCVSLSRNLVGFPFPSRLSPEGAREILGRVGGVLEKNGFTRMDFADLTRTVAVSLAEKRYISHRILRESLPHALFLNDPCNLSVTACAEDHIRIRCVTAGLCLLDAFEGAAKVEALLDQELELAFDGRLGYLTASPSELGTALRASVILSLPMLSLAGRMEHLSRGLSQRGLSLHSLAREQTDPPCGLYSLSNRTILGISEEELLSRLEEGVRGVLEAERQARESARGEEAERLADRIQRAEGVLRYARILKAEEMIPLLGLLRAGAALGITSGIKVETLTALLVEAMPATLSLGVEPPPKNTLERNILRARVVKERLFGV